MYHRIVAARVRTAWSLLADRRVDELLRGFADSFTHTFAGDHALGGTRRSKARQREWFARLFRLLPDAQFSVRDVVVAGGPWRTRVVTVVDVRVPSHPWYRNTVMQLLELRWGKIVAVENLEDTQALARLLDELASERLTEAAEPPITGE